MNESIEIELVSGPTDEVVALVEGLEAELSQDYAPHQRHGFSVARIFQPDMLFFIARLDGQPAGCGGIAVGAEFAEVKRMYVRPDSRGRGVAQKLLARLEAEARARGVRRLTLETGDVRHSALRLYEGAGFRRCGAFGAYLSMVPDAIERSVFMEKQIEL